MDFLTINYSLKDEKLKAENYNISVDSSEEIILPWLPEKEKRVYMVTKDTLPFLTKYQDTEDTLRVKSHNYGLTRLYTTPKHKGITLIEIPYAHLEKAKDAIDKFLKKFATSPGEMSAKSPIVFLGVQTERFSEGWEEVTGSPLPKLASISATPNPPVLQKVKKEKSVPLQLSSSEQAVMYQKNPEDMFWGISPQAQKIREKIESCAKHDSTVLLLGDTGTGKDVVARAIHASSWSKSGRFVAINCGAIPEEIFESELFGHVKGSFTDAKFAKIGLLVEGHNGSVFLDEIGEMSLRHQVKLLRFLEDRRVKRIGEEDSKATSVVTRIIDASNQKLDSMAQSGQFRQDLYYRLCVFPIRIPPLCEREGDIEYLAQRFWQERITKDPHAKLGDELIALLCAYKFPGNVRELKLILERFYATFKGTKEYTAKDLQDILDDYGVNLTSKELESTEKQIVNIRVKCLQALMNASACASTLATLVEDFLADGIDKQKLQNILQHRLPSLLEFLETELEEPLYFYDDKTYDAVNSVKGKVQFFKGMLEANMLKEAKIYAQNVLTPKLKKMNKAVFKSWGVLVKG